MFRINLQRVLISGNYFISVAEIAIRYSIVIPISSNVWINGKSFFVISNRILKIFFLFLRVSFFFSCKNTFPCESCIGAVRVRTNFCSFFEKNEIAFPVFTSGESFERIKSENKKQRQKAEIKAKKIHFEYSY